MTYAVKRERTGMRLDKGEGVVGGGVKGKKKEVGRIIRKIKKVYAILNQN